MWQKKITLKTTHINRYYFQLLFKRTIFQLLQVRVGPMQVSKEKAVRIAGEIFTGQKPFLSPHQQC